MHGNTQVMTQVQLNVDRACCTAVSHLCHICQQQQLVICYSSMCMSMQIVVSTQLNIDNELYSPSIITAFKSRQLK